MLVFPLKKIEVRLEVEQFFRSDENHLCLTNNEISNVLSPHMSVTTLLPTLLFFVTWMSARQESGRCSSVDQTR